MRARAITLAVAVSSLALVSVTAQVRPAISTENEFSSLLAQNLGDERRITAVLRGALGTYSRDQQGKLADILTSKAVENRVNAYGPGDSSSYASAFRAVVILGQSAAPVDPKANGAPYDGAIDRLVRIAQEAPVLVVRMEAMRMMLGTVSRRRALAAISAIAEHGGAEDAWTAVGILIGDASGLGSLTNQTASQREESVAALRSLVSNGRINSPSAAQQAEVWLRNQKP